MKKWPLLTVIIGLILTPLITLGYLFAGSALMLGSLTTSNSEAKPPAHYTGYQIITWPCQLASIGYVKSLLILLLTLAIACGGLLSSAEVGKSLAMPKAVVLQLHNFASSDSLLLSNKLKAELIQEPDSSLNYPDFNHLLSKIYTDCTGVNASQSNTLVSNSFNFFLNFNREWATRVYQTKLHQVLAECSPNNNLT